VPAGSLVWWGDRLGKYGVAVNAVETRFGDTVLPIVDPHGLRVALTESARPQPRAFTPWDGSPIPVERQIRGLYGAQLWERDEAATATFVAAALGLRVIARENGWTRYGADGGPGVIDVKETPGERRGSWGVGSVHHLAWRVADLDEELIVRAQVEAAGGRATEVIDRFWFKSVYFKEPGGVLFEIATEGPGFAVDEDASRLGEALVLPPWYEPARAEIERGLTPLKMPVLQ